MTIQWVLCETGSTLAAIVALGINMQVESQDAGAPNAVYIVFVVIQVVAMILALLLLVRPKNVVRSDGTRLAIFKAPTVKNELLGIWAMVTDYKFMVLLPPIFAAEMALALQSSLNGYYFNLRTRSLNNVMFNFIQIPASFFMTWILDSPRFGQRKTRALLGITVMGVITLGICAAEAGWLAVNGIDRTAPGPSVDWTDPTFAGPFVIYVIYGSVYRLVRLIEMSVNDADSKLAQHLSNCHAVRDYSSYQRAGTLSPDGRRISWRHCFRNVLQLHHRRQRWLIHCAVDIPICLLFRRHCLPLFRHDQVGDEHQLLLGDVCDRA